MQGQGWLALGAVIAFALIHLFGARLRFLAATPRSIWLSAAGGVSVAYVFVHLLPELAEWQERLADEVANAPGVLGAIERHAYLVALVGLMIFYGVDRLARSATGGGRSGEEGRKTPYPVFWTHLGAFALYNLLIGYLLVQRERADLRGLAIYVVAMGLHFLVNDQGLRQQHGHSYQREGRWLLAAAPLLGWLLGMMIKVSNAALSGLFALLAGGVILNVLKEELPEDRQSRFWAFAVGALAYASLLLGTG